MLVVTYKICALYSRSASLRKTERKATAAALQPLASSPTFALTTCGCESTYQATLASMSPATPTLTHSLAGLSISSLLHYVCLRYNIFHFSVKT